MLALLEAVSTLQSALGLIMFFLDVWDTRDRGIDRRASAGDELAAKFSSEPWFALFPPYEQAAYQ
jgi:hypothetical protein